MTSSRFVRRFRLSGRIAADDQFHQIRLPGRALEAPDEHLIPPTIVNVNITVPPGTGTIGVPQYAPTVVGAPAASYDPPGDCGGNYMSYKFQANNNCYAYGCNISTNTFPQPGRQSGFLLTAANFQTSVTALGQTVSSYAVKDGLIFVGTAMADLTGFKSSRQGAALNGHFVALMVSPAGDQNWPGDYHWARCDNSSGPCDSWSQKDGGDQVTNFDFAGQPITNPATANWTVNQGPLSQAVGNNQDLVVDYQFYCFMFVPASSVNII
ncbi:hypothetical protein [Bradyrhizobium elkanii]|uniref:hypothetical protein n=1 Tax=Bradyrhizobium elkanii TaxID=29448 RepID=UPI0021680F60|nr:hypothetical protein [Bradyrhizobium elkanii]MCS3519245.1 hypothetical protein [Bradyrhizobium elkanii]MCS4066903.1 hypothetical protein [Bradyrhizobium elkanii]MCS4082438.1 hypothetical protein [Bradyrhizobium elkanii]MCW2127948.1 hypothetical protein [Bradyrhizobium elkanii]MCW2174689.1 hypothetical protein [Bradyrhizobium elkanii]